MHNTSTSYGRVARILHWSVAILILMLLMGGFISSKIPRTAENVEMLKSMYSVHKTLGVTVLMLAIIRILWAFTQTRPVPIHPERKVETLAAELVHYGLYVAIILMPLSGWVMHSAEEGFAPILWPFGQNLPFVPKSEHVAAVAGTVHLFAAYTIVLAVLAHVGGALKHALFDKDGTLARMWRGTSAGSAQTGHSGVQKALPFVALAGWAGIVGLAVMSVPKDAPAPSVATAEAPMSDNGWSVTEGTLAIAIDQMGAEVRGAFASWEAQINYDENTGTGDVVVTIDTSSLTLGSVTSQALGAEFFNVSVHPSAVFKADIARLEEEQHEAVGTLTLIGQEAPVTLKMQLEIIDGGTAVMTGETTLDRRSFGMGAGYPDESNVGFAVPVTVSLTAQKQN